MLRAVLLTTATLMLLAGCDAKPTEVGPGASNETASATPAPSRPIKLPPSIAASKQYRCADNSLALVEWYSDDLSASVRTRTDGKDVRVTAPAKGEAMTGGGYVLKGTRMDANVSFGSPEHPKPQKCHV